MDELHILDVKEALLRGVIVAACVIGASLALLVVSGVLASIPFLYPLFATFVLLTVGVFIFFPWEMADKALGLCTGLPPQCDTEANLFILLVVSLGTSFIFYACVSFIIGIMKQCVIVTVRGHRNIVVEVRRKTLVTVLSFFLCLFLAVLIIGNYANLGLFINIPNAD